MLLYQALIINIVLFSLFFVIGVLIGRYLTLKYDLKNKSKKISKKIIVKKQKKVNDANEQIKIPKDLEGW